jgi:cytochrome b561
MLGCAVLCGMSLVLLIIPWCIGVLVSLLWVVRLCWSVTTGG